MGRYIFIAVIALGIATFALAGWTVKGARKLGRSRRPRPTYRPAFA